MEASSDQEWQFHICTVRAHVGRSTGRSVKNGDMRFLLLELILTEQLPDLPPNRGI